MATSKVLQSAFILAAASAVAVPAMAGGISRGNADTSNLYETDDITARSSLIYVIPKRGFATVEGAKATDGTFTENYVMPSVSIKANIAQNLACAFTYAQPFGANIKYGPQAIKADGDHNTNSSPPFDPQNKGTDLIAHEYGATCAVNFELGRGNFYLIGGGFIQSLNYKEYIGADVSGVPTYMNGSLILEDDSAFGYRLGGAYAIKDYALRVEALYRSAVEHKATGTLAIPGAALYPAKGGGTLPQSFELNVQTGIAPGWLALGSVKWTDWSVLPSFDYTYTGGFGHKIFNWRDGWTVMAGVGHAFNDDVSGAMTVTWDRGVGTGANLIMTDTWTLGAAAQIKAGPGVARIGGAVSYLTSGYQSTAKGADFNATADGDWAYALNASYKIAF